MLHVRLLGNGRASYDGRPLASFPGKSCHRLLCYLLLNPGRPHIRERLAAVFWAEYPTSASRTYLRNCLWQLRRALEEAGDCPETYLQCTGDSITLLNSGGYWLDVDAFDEAVAGCRDLPGDQLSAGQAAALAEAERLYGGDLLESLYDDWCLLDRERLRLMHLNLLGTLLAYHEAAGTYEEGLDYAGRILERAPTWEKVHRQVMRLHWLDGRPQEALAQYRSCLQVLREEFGAQPTAKTTALYEQMLQGRFDPGQWPVHRHDDLPPRLALEPIDRSPVEQALERLRRLEATNELIRAELREVRRLIEGPISEGDEGR